MTKARFCCVLAAFVLLGLAPKAAVPNPEPRTRNPAPHFFPDDPISREPDPNDASHVEPFPIHLAWDIVSSLLNRSRELNVGRAGNINTVDEVPDSEWFTNRAGSRPLTPGDVARGPDVTNGPAEGRWTVVSGKSEGIRPGFTIVDTAGVRWFLKFDAPGYPEQATSAEVVATKLFWAVGYNVAETHVATLWPANLVLDPKATITVNGRKRPLTKADVHRVLDQVERSPDGSYRALASRALDGKPIGEFLYYGTRADDPNDVVPHENRRELRGMRVFAAWIDRVDAKAGNTLDTLVTEHGRTVVRHHVLDFGSTLGSGGIAPNEYWEGYEYLYERAALLKKLPGLGFPVEPWRIIRYPHLRGLGRLEGDRFDPTLWKSRVPNAAYTLADPDDTFWAARKAMAITDAMIAAAVDSGRYSDPAARTYLAETLIKRRDAIGRAYLTAINPIVDPTLDDGGRLLFHNAALDCGLSSDDGGYKGTWYRFDNATGESVRMGESPASRVREMQAPGTLTADIGAFVRVDVSAASGAHPSWNAPVRVWFHRTADAWKLVGLERQE